MKISGFTMLRNGVQYGYPFEESLRSFVPLVDELVIVVGKGNDSTLERVQALAQEFTKIKVQTSEWDPNLRKGGLILSQQTNLAMSYCTGDWGIYLQADEVFHEEDYASILRAIGEANGRPEVCGLLFRYEHFYGDYFIVSKNPSAYRHEIRAVRLRAGVESWKDAQGFRIKTIDGKMEKVRTIDSGARIFHYGWVRPPEVMKEKTVGMDQLYHSDGAGTGDNHIYKRIYGLEKFQGTHPKVMRALIEGKKWKVDLLQEPLVFSWKDIRKVLARWVEILTGRLPFEYRNYIRID